MAGGLRVVDTSAWIEWLEGGHARKEVGKAFSTNAHCIVPTLVQFELTKWLVREAGEDRADQVIAFTETCIVEPLDTAIALLAVELHREYKLAPADALIYATARRRDAELLTCDARFRGLPGVILVPNHA